MKKRFATILLTVVIFMAMAATSKAAHATSGTIFDFGKRRLVGVWVEVEGGNSGWASWKSIGGEANYISWNYDTQGKPFQLHIGVGGTPMHWGRTVKTNWLRRNARNVRVEIFYNPYLDRDHPKIFY